MECEETLHTDAQFFSVITTQLSLKIGTNKWKGKRKVADKSEMKKLHLRDTSKPRHYRELTKYQNKSIMESHMFLKEKRDGTIKGITMSVGNNQRDFISKEYSSSPTVATKYLLLSCIIDAEEERYVSVIYDPNALIHT